MYRVSYAMEKRSEWRNTNVLMNKYFKKDEEEQEVLRETYKELVEYLLSIYNIPMVFITLAKL